MGNIIQKSFLAIQLILSRSLSHWKLYFTVVVGVLLSSMIMAGTVLYFDALKEISLQHTFEGYGKNELNILLQADRGPVSYDESQRLIDVMELHYERDMQWFVSQMKHAGKTPTFSITPPGDEINSGDDNARSYFSYFPELSDYVFLSDGKWPSNAGKVKSGEVLELEVLISSESAIDYNLVVGDKFSVIPYWDDVTPFVSVTITGIFGKEDEADNLWYLEDTAMKAKTKSMDTIPLYVSEESFMTNLGPAFPKMNATYVWLMESDPNAISTKKILLAQNNLVNLRSSLTAAAFSYREKTSLDEAMYKFETRQFFSQFPMMILMILIVCVVLYYVIMLATILVEQQKEEIILMRVRGANSLQILGVFLAEGFFVCVIASLLGPILALFVISFLGITPVFEGLTGGDLLPVQLSISAFLMGGVGGVLSFLALLIPAIHASRMGVQNNRSNTSRPIGQSLFQRYYIDVMLIIVGLLLFRQLTEQGSVIGRQLFGEMVISQLILVTPALMMIGAALIILRLFPLAMRLFSRLLSSVMPVGPMLGLWNMSRNPTHYARLALLLVLTAGLGVFATSFGSTLERSFKERVLYSTGADIKISGITLNDKGDSKDVVQSYENLDGVSKATPIIRGFGYDVSKLSGETYEMLAVDSEEFLKVAWARNDFADSPLDDLLKELGSKDLPEGILIPDDATSLIVRVMPHLSRDDLVLSARVKDSNDRYFNYTFGTLCYERSSMLFSNLAPKEVENVQCPKINGEWIEREVRLEKGIVQGRSFWRRQVRYLPLQPEHPMRLVSLTIHNPSVMGALTPGSLMIDDISYRTDFGRVEQKVLYEFDEDKSLNVLKMSQGSQTDQLQIKDLGGIENTTAAEFSWTAGQSRSSRGIYFGSNIDYVPVLANEKFLTTTGHRVGSKVRVSLLGRPLDIKIIDKISYFPTANTIANQYLIADLDSVRRYSNLATTKGELNINEIWISSDLQGEERENLTDHLLFEPFPNQQVKDRSKSLLSSTVDPLVSAGWTGLLFVAFGSVMLVSVVGFLVHSYVSFQNRELQFALMRTIGLSSRQLMSLLWMEQILVIVTALILGSWMGGRLAAIIMPFLAHNDFGHSVLPPFVIEVDWGNLIAAYLFMGIFFTLVMMVMVWFANKLSIQRTLRLGER